MLDVAIASLPRELVFQEVTDWRGEPPATSSTRFEIKVDCHTPREFDRISSGFADVSYDQTAAFSRIQWGTERGSEITLWQGGACVAAARIVVLKPPLMKSGIAYVRSGPIWRRSDAASDREIYREALRAIIAEYGVRRGHSVVVVPRPNPESYADDVNTLENLGFSVGRSHPDPNRYFVDLTLDEEAQMSSLDQKWRYNLRKALNNGLEFQHGEGAEDLARFLSLHRSMVVRKRYYDTDRVDCLSELLLDLPRELKPRVVVVKKGATPLVGAVIAPIGDTALYLFGASDDAALPLRAGYALQWWIVRWLSGEGFRWYDLGGEALSPGLRQFKSGLVGKKGRVVPMGGDLVFATNWRASVATEMVFAARWARRIMRRCIENAQAVGA